MVKDFINRFDHTNPDWAQLPAEWPDCDLQRLTFDEIGKLNGIKTLWEISRPTRPKQKSRVWSDPEGYKWLVPWSNAVLLRFLIRKFTESLPQSEYRRKAQVDDAARSVVRNIEEGYKRATTSEYIDFIGYSQGSLEEVKGDVRELTEDGFLRSQPGAALVDVGIDLGEFHGRLKERRGKVKEVTGEIEEDNKGMVQERKTPWDYRPVTVLYPPLSNIYAKDLTYEMFLELINKTDYLLRTLVASLERKLAADRQGYQIQQMKLRDKFRKTQTV